MFPISIHYHLVNNWNNFKINHEFMINLVLRSAHFEIKAVLILKVLGVRDLGSSSYMLIIMLPFFSWFKDLTICLLPNDFKNHHVLKYFSGNYFIASLIPLDLDSNMNLNYYFLHLHNENLHQHHPR